MFDFEITREIPAIIKVFRVLLAIGMSLYAFMVYRLKKSSDLFDETISAVQNRDQNYFEGTPVKVEFDKISEKTIQKIALKSLYPFPMYPHIAALVTALVFMLIVVDDDVITYMIYVFVLVVSLTEAWKIKRNGDLVELKLFLIWEMLRCESDSEGEEGEGSGAPAAEGV